MYQAVNLMFTLYIETPSRYNWHSHFGVFKHYHYPYILRLGVFLFSLMSPCLRPARIPDNLHNTGEKSLNLSADGGS